jgi:hypothetical protein
VELDVLERLARAGERDLALGGAVGELERRLRRAPAGDRAQVADRERGVEPPRARAQRRPLEAQQRGEVAASGQPALHAGSHT